MGSFAWTQITASFSFHEAPGDYGAYAAGGYPGYGGVYAHRSYVTGRPTLFPRYYRGW